MIKDEKLQYKINREAAKISALSSGKTDTHEFLTREEKLLSDQSRIIQQTEITYSPLGKAFEEQIITIEDQRIKQVEVLPEENQELESIEGLFPNKMGTNEINN